MSPHKHLQLEISRKTETEKTEKLRNEIEFMTPILKGFLTEAAQEATRHCIQIHGGRGCVNQFGVEQLYRDSLQLTIHHGTTGLQVGNHPSWNLSLQLLQGIRTTHTETLD